MSGPILQTACAYREGAWTRISAQVYNQLSDYQELAVAVLELKAELEAGVPADRGQVIESES